MTDDVDLAERTLVMRNRWHLRSAAAISHMASTFPCAITIRHHTREADAKSIIAVMPVVNSAHDARGTGSPVTIRARGERAAEAVEALACLITGGFGGVLS